MALNNIVVLANSIDQQIELQNGWVPAFDGHTPFLRRTRMGMIMACGIAASGTITDGTQLFQVPDGYIPEQMRSVFAFCKLTGGGYSPVRLHIDPSGSATIDGIPAPVDWISLDNIGWCP